MQRLYKQDLLLCGQNTVVNAAVKPVINGVRVERSRKLRYADVSIYECKSTGLEDLQHLAQRLEEKLLVMDYFGDTIKHVRG